jgi:hypothetical protein
MGTAEAHKLKKHRATPQQTRTVGYIDNDERIAFSREQGRKLREKMDQAQAQDRY